MHWRVHQNTLLGRVWGRSPVSPHSQGLVELSSSASVLSLVMTYNIHESSTPPSKSGLCSIKPNHITSPQTVHLLINCPQMSPYSPTHMSPARPSSTPSSPQSCRTAFPDGYKSKQSQTSDSDHCYLEPSRYSWRFWAFWSQEHVDPECWNLLNLVFILKYERIVRIWGKMWPFRVQEVKKIFVTCPFRNILELCLWSFVRFL